MIPILLYRFLGVLVLLLQRPSPLPLDRRFGITLNSATLLHRCVHRRQHIIALEQPKRKMFAAVHSLAPHILFRATKNPNLSKLFPWIGIPSSKLAIFVISPAVQISILVCHVSKVLAN